MFAGESSSGDTHPYSGGKAKSWTPRACDRCRKRKAKCDDKVPCKNCSEAGAECLHHAPVLKRGPRPRGTQSTAALESRIKTLESLITSISGGNAQGSLTLSSSELHQIQLAAQATPGSDASPQEIWHTFDPLSYMSSTVEGTGVPMEWTDIATPWIEPKLGGEIAVDASTGTSSGNMDVLGGLEGYGTSDGMGAWSMTGESSNSVRKAAAPTGNQILYRDSEGQTKWLGPSSGMPLLDRLKSDMPSDESPIMSLAEEWISLSAAIGMPVDTQTLPSPKAPDRQSNRVEKADDPTLWPAFLAICPQDLIDGLVRAYFTISYLLWPILHAPTFMTHYTSSPSHRRDPSFVALVLSVCCLSSRYAQDARLADPALISALSNFATETVTRLASNRNDLYIVQAMFNLSVFQEGTSTPAFLWSYLSRALSMALELGLHRSVDEYSAFTAVDVEERKRTMYALYAQNVKASCTYGRPILLRLEDLDLEEPHAVDDVYISADTGTGLQPMDRPSVMAGFVAAVRLHMILEQTVRRLNQARRSDIDSTSFVSLCRPVSSIETADRVELLDRVTEGLPGDWSFTPASTTDPDSVQFFQKTRIFTLQHFIRLLEARHAFNDALERLAVASTSSGGRPTEILRQIIRHSLGIIGTYCAIDQRGRLGFFGAHAIAQLTQAGAGLISVILYLRPITSVENQAMLHLAQQGLPAVVQTLRALGKRRPAGLRSAELLVEFTRACRIPLFTGLDQEVTNGTAETKPPRPVEVPMLSALSRRPSISAPLSGLHDQSAAQRDTAGNGNEFDQWLDLALLGSSGAWTSTT